MLHFVAITEKSNKAKCNKMKHVCTMENVMVEVNDSINGYVAIWI